MNTDNKDQFISLTDEQASAIGKLIMRGALTENALAESVKEFLCTPAFYRKSSNLTGSDWLKVFQYCQSEGIALPSLYESSIGRLFEVIHCKCGAAIAACLIGHEDDEWIQDKQGNTERGYTMSTQETVGWSKCTCEEREGNS